MTGNDARNRRHDLEPQRGPMRILQISPYFAPAFRFGGPPRSILGLCQGLQRAGADVQVFTSSAGTPESQLACGAYEGVPVRYFPLCFPRRFFHVAGLRDVIASTVRQFDLVHIHCLWNMTTWAAAQGARAAGVPYVISPRGMLETAALHRHNLRKRAAYLVIERRNLEGASGLHATSSQEARSVARFKPHAEIAEIPNGVSAVDVPPARGTFRRRLSIDRDAPLVLFLGRLHPIKRLDLLASAFERVAAHSPGARLVIAGRGADNYEATARSFFAGLSGNVVWAGEVAEAEKWSLIHDSDLLVMCSDSENFGTSVLEALAMGTPVVTTRGCPWEDAQEFGCGLWVEQQTDVLADAIIDLLRHPQRLRTMGERGRIFARERYGWESIGKAMADWYASILGRTSIGGSGNSATKPAAMGIRG